MTAELSKTKRIFLWLILSAMVLTLLFIFTNSLRPPEESMEQSNALADFMAGILSPETPLGAFVQDYIRKIGHFVEYGILGAEVAVFVSIYLQNKRKMMLLSLPLAVCVAVFDETLQYFSGRGPAVSDVWIDFSGFTVFALAAYGAIRLIFYIKEARSKAGTEENNG